jgi:hypothetical protein
MNVRSGKFWLPVLLLVPPALAGVAAAWVCRGAPPASVPVSRAGGKLGPAVELRLEALERSSTPGGAEAELVLTMVPGFDAEGCRVEFVLPRGWTPLTGPAERTEDFIAGRESVFRLAAHLAPGAPRAVAARVTAGGLRREIYAPLGAVPPSGLAGRPDEDAQGNRLRVFPSGEGGKR